MYGALDVMELVAKLKTQATQSTASIEIVIFTLQKLKHACRFEKGGWCRESRKTCSPQTYPLPIK